MTIIVTMRQILIIPVMRIPLMIVVTIRFLRLRVLVFGDGVKAIQVLVALRRRLLRAALFCLIVKTI